jgi:hypothetical protein
VGQLEYRWSDRGRLAAAKYGVDLAEVIDALEAPPGLRVERRLKDLVIVEGMAAAGRVILVVAERISHNLNVFRILLARPLGPEAFERWRKELL